MKELTGYSILDKMSTNSFVKLNKKVELYCRGELGLTKEDEYKLAKEIAEFFKVPVKEENIK